VSVLVALGWLGLGGVLRWKSRARCAGALVYMAIWGRLGNNVRSGRGTGIGTADRFHTSVAISQASRTAPSRGMKSEKRRSFGRLLYEIFDRSNVKHIVATKGDLLNSPRDRG
jgi:hypothetical protein